MTHPRTKRLASTALLAMLTLACLFFVVYDLVAVHIAWSLGIYLPCMAIFAVGLVGWIGAGNDEAASPLSARRLLRIHAILLALVTLAIIGYASYLCATGAWEWGLLTLAISAVMAWLVWSSATVGWGEG